MFWYFNPENCGNDLIWRAYFSTGLKPPTRFFLRRNNGWDLVSSEFFERRTMFCKKTTVMIHKPCEWWVLFCFTWCLKVSSILVYGTNYKDGFQSGFTWQFSQNWFDSEKLQAGSWFYMHIFKVVDQQKIKLNQCSLIDVSAVLLSMFNFNL